MAKIPSPAGPDHDCASKTAVDQTSGSGSRGPETVASTAMWVAP